MAIRSALNTWKWPYFNSILLCWNRHLLLCLLHCFRYVLWQLELKCPESDVKRLMLCHVHAPLPNPTLNLPDSVDERKGYIKMHSLMQLCCFNFFIHGFGPFCRTVVSRDSYLSASPPSAMLYRMSILPYLIVPAEKNNGHHHKICNCFTGYNGTCIGFQWKL